MCYSASYSEKRENILVKYYGEYENLGISVEINRISRNITYNQDMSKENTNLIQECVLESQELIR